MKKRNAFTLIEILVVLVIVAMLMWVLFEIYITISRITFRVEQQKYVNEELLFVSDTLQNLSNRNSIDYEAYWDILFHEKWLVTSLCLSWQDGKIAIYPKCNSGICNLYMRKGWNCMKDVIDNDVVKETLLTPTSKVYFEDVKFKVVPFESLDYTLESKCEENGSNVYVCRNNQWFWFMSTIYYTWYDKDRWTHNISLNVQQFFNN